ncbi:MAG: division/cell wall cluster transcriptional repressor MraZ [Candidatus Eremiobacteraeota bacterium]|nr:division/cell wall cluster transcriptional repressor MraZ [Candidatus Eremiobacteraeota bacterium]
MVKGGNKWEKVKMPDLKTQFTGEHKYSLDSKGRLIIPAELREGLGESFYMVRGLERCISLFPPGEWAKLVAKMEELPISNPYARSLVRFFGSGVRLCEPDSHCRIIIPPPWRDHAGLDKKVVLVGVFNKVEVWSDENWAKASRTNYQGELAVAEDLAAQIIALGI